VDVEPTQNVEALFDFRWSFDTYDRPKTNLDVSFQYYPSLSNVGRQRIQLDAGVKREFWKDLFLALNLRWPSRSGMGVKATSYGHLQPGRRVYHCRRLCSTSTGI
jgi:hypothetical protein